MTGREGPEYDGPSPIANQTTHAAQMDEIEQSLLTYDEMTPQPVSFITIENPSSLHEQGSGSTMSSHVGGWVLTTIFLGLLFTGFYFLSQEFLAPILEWHSHLEGAAHVVTYMVLFFIVSLPFTFGYVIACVGAGYIFGLIWGIVISASSTLLSSMLVFEMSRFCFQQRANRLAEGYANFHAIRTLLDEPGLAGIKMIAMLRLSPLPVGVATMLLSVCDMSIWWQTLGSFVGMLPTQVMYCVIGSTLPSRQQVTDGDFDPYVLVAELVLMILVTWYISYSVRRSIAKMALDAKRYSRSDEKTPLMG